MSNYKSSLQSNNEALSANNLDLQSLIEQANALPDAGDIELPDLTNEGSANDLLLGKELIDSDGNIVTGTIVTKTSSDLTANEATVIVPAGYYSSSAYKSVKKADRANTTISVTADDTNDKLIIIASNNQETGYVVGTNKTASKTISLTTNNETIIASDGTTSITKSVAKTTQATPSITVDSSGLITASTTQAAGYVAAGSKSATKQLTTQAAKTITPSKSSQTAVSSGVYTTGAVTVAPIPSEYITTTDATATADEIMSGETAYVNGEKVTGIFTIENEITEQDALLEQLRTTLSGKSAGVKVRPIAEEKDVNFYDYDGRCLYSYTLEEVRSLTALPELPEHDGLICQGWNWTIDELLEWDFYADVGAIYITDSGETRIYIDLKSLLNTPITLCFNQTVEHGVEIDIGNGARTVAGTGSVSLDLTFPSVGQYVIRMKATSGTFSFDRSVFNGNYANLCSITAVNFGENLTGFGQDAFRYARNMRTITLPELELRLGPGGAFRDSGLLAYIVPRSMAAIGAITNYNNVYGCYSLKVISFFNISTTGGIPANSGQRDCVNLRRFVYASNKFTANPNYGFSGSSALEFIHIKPTAKLSQISIQLCANCYALQEFNIPYTVTDIYARAFYRCYSLKRLRFYPVTPPVVANADAFTDIPTTCIVEVPAESLEVYQNATNYASIAAQMVGV